MFLRIIILVSILLNFSFGDSSKGISSISYQRDDVPLPFHSSVHLHPKKRIKSNNNVHLNRLPGGVAEVYKSIQYAPLALNRKEKDHTIHPNRNEFVVAESQKNSRDYILEPFLHYESSNPYLNIHTTPRFIVGLNIEHSKPNKIRYDDKLDLLYQNNDGPFKKENPSADEEISVFGPSKSLKTDIFRNTNALQETIRTHRVFLPILENAHSQAHLNPCHNAKVPHLHINVARSYNIARAPYKALDYSYKNI